MPAELAVTLLFHQTEELMAGGTVEVGYGLGLTIALRIPAQSSTPPTPMPQSISGPWSSLGVVSTEEDVLTCSTVGPLLAVVSSSAAHSRR